MIKLRPAAERGRADYGWLDTRHSFSFNDYHDAHHMGFRALRVINEDWIAPGKGFGTHGHRDMEIVTYVLEGAVAHKDSLGNGSVLRPGEFQRMTAGTGIEHSEFNPSETEPVHLYQIWLFPEKRGLPRATISERFRMRSDRASCVSSRRRTGGTGRSPSVKIRKSFWQRLPPESAYRTSLRRGVMPGFKCCAEQSR